MDVLKDEIAMNCNSDTLLVFPEAKRLTTGIRYWLEDLMANGVVVCCFAVTNPGRDIFLKMLEVELELPRDTPQRGRQSHRIIRLHLQSNRLFHCSCQEHLTRSFNPLAILLPERTSPELLYLESKYASLMSYGLSVKLLEELLPFRWRNKHYICTEQFTFIRSTLGR